MTDEEALARKIINDLESLSYVEFDENDSFSSGTHDEVAILNWNTQCKSFGDLLARHAQAYMQGAKVLCTLCLPNIKNADVQIFPILILFTQGYELYLKAIRWALNEINGKESKNIKDKNHDLLKINKEIENLFTDLPDDFKPLSEKTDKVQKIFEDIAKCCHTELGALSSFSRYPMDSKNHLFEALIEPNEEDVKEEEDINVAFNMFKLVKAIPNVFVNLSKVYSELDLYLESIREKNRQQEY